MNDPREISLAAIRPARAMSHHTTVLIAEAVARNQVYPTVPLSGYAAGRQILASGPQVKLTLILDALAWLDARQRVFSGGGWNFQQDVWLIEFVLRGIVASLSRSRLELDPTSIEEMLAHVGRAESWWMLPIGSIITMIEGWCSRSGKTFDAEEFLSPELRGRLQTFAEGLAHARTAEHRHTGERLMRLLLGDTAEPRLIRKPVRPWAVPLNGLASTPTKHQGHWVELFKHARTSENKSAPSGSWLKTAESLSQKIGQAAVTQMTLDLLDQCRPDPSQPDPNDNILKGLIWILGRADPAVAVGPVGRFAGLCFQKVPGVGARSHKLGNACLNSLTEMPGLEPLSQLARIRNTTRYPSVRSLINRKLEHVSQRVGLAQADIEELSAPNYGLSAAGELRQAIGEWDALLSLNDRGEVMLQWVGRDRKPRASPPKALRDLHQTEVTNAKRLARTIAADLVAQGRRIERLLVTDRRLDFATWRERYGNHPLVSSLARRLIWWVAQGDSGVPALWRGEDFEQSDGTPLAIAGAQISLWHPIQSSAATVLAWRQRLRTIDISQPFKQAFREIYRLTDAERNTSIYSNRFAAHILRQHQLSQLCQQRGWRYSLQGMFDNANTPSLELPGDLTADFFVEGIEGEETASAIHFYVATDQVRFRHRDGREPLVLDQIPETVFSEVMRDVDLFVSVCSIGNNPEWMDSGPRFQHYWHEYSFGNLTEFGHSRRAMLEEVLPALAIAGHCEIDSKYMRVRGQIRNYKIHIGSGNILMEPNDQYLCIVPGPAPPGKQPGSVINFDGDRIFSIIVSKAMLLVKDDEITDPSIASQLRAGLA